MSLFYSIPLTALAIVCAICMFQLQVISSNLFDMAGIAWRQNDVRSFRTFSTVSSCTNVVSFIMLHFGLSIFVVAWPMFFSVSETSHYERLLFCMGIGVSLSLTRVLFIVLLIRRMPELDPVVSFHVFDSNPDGTLTETDVGQINLSELRKRAAAAGNNGQDIALTPEEVMKRFGTEQPPQQ